MSGGILQNSDPNNPGSPFANISPEAWKLDNYEEAWASAIGGPSSSLPDLRELAFIGEDRPELLSVLEKGIIPDSEIYTGLLSIYSHAFFRSIGDLPTQRTLCRLATLDQKLMERLAEDYVDAVRLFCVTKTFPEHESALLATVSLPLSSKVLGNALGTDRYREMLGGIIRVFTKLSSNVAQDLSDIEALLQDRISITDPNFIPKLFEVGLSGYKPKIISSNSTDEVANTTAWKERLLGTVCRLIIGNQVLVNRVGEGTLRAVRGEIRAKSLRFNRELVEEEISTIGLLTTMIDSLKKQ